MSKVRQFGDFFIESCFFARTSFWHPPHFHLLSASNISGDVNRLNALSTDSAFRSSYRSVIWSFIHSSWPGMGECIDVKEKERGREREKRWRHLREIYQETGRTYSIYNCNSSKQLDSGRTLQRLDAVKWSVQPSQSLSPLRYYNEREVGSNTVLLVLNQLQQKWLRNHMDLVPSLDAGSLKLLHQLSEEFMRVLLPSDSKPFWDTLQPHSYSFRGYRPLTIRAQGSLDVAFQNTE